jgi:AraC family transcriptional activator of pobA
MSTRKENPEFRSIKNVFEGSPFVIRTIREIRDEEEGGLLPHRQPQFELICVSHGGGELWIDLQKMELENDRVYCIAPGQVHQLVPDGDAEGFSIAFTETFPDAGEYDPDLSYPGGFLHLFKNAGGIRISEEAREDIREIIVKMRKEFHNIYPFRLQVIKRYLRIVLIYLGRHLHEDLGVTAHTRDKELVQDFMGLIDKHFKKTKTVSEYASALSITPNYLNEIVKRTTGHPAGHHIRQRVVLEAKRMGLYSHTSMKEIAYNLGFSDCGHFSKFFKTVTGKNFSAFKREKLSVLVA